MSVKPTTRLGYYSGIEPAKHFTGQQKDIPYDREGSSGAAEFVQGRSRPRMAGEIDIFTAEPDYLRPPIKGLWLNQPALRLSTPLRQPPGGSPIPDETDFF